MLGRYTLEKCLKAARNPLDSPSQANTSNIEGSSPRDTVRCAPNSAIMELYLNLFNRIHNETKHLEITGSPQTLRLTSIYN